MAHKQWIQDDSLNVKDGFEHDHSHQFGGTLEARAIKQLVERCTSNPTLQPISSNPGNAIHTR